MSYNPNHGHQKSSGGGFFRLLTLLVSVGIAGAAFYFVNAQVDKAQDNAAELAKDLQDNAQQNVANHGGQKSSLGSSGKGDEKSETERQLDKIGLHIDCMYGLRLIESMDRYDLWVDMEKGPTCEESYIYGMYTLDKYSLEGCQKALDAAQNATPKLAEIDPLIESFVDAYTQIFPIVNEAEAYYDLGDYKDDACKRGQELHVELVSKYATFRESYNKLYELIEPAKMEVDMAWLKEIEDKKGRKIDWHIQMLYRTSRTLNNTFNDAGLLENITKETSLEAAKAFESAYADFVAYVDANPADADLIMNISSIKSGAESMVKEVKDIRRAIEAGTPVTQYQLDNFWRAQNSL